MYKRQELFEKWPGSKYADHAIGNRELQSQLRDIFRTKTSKEWLSFGNEHNTPLAPVNSPENISQDPQFQDRFPLYPHETHAADMMPFPVKFLDEELPAPSRAPTAGEHNEDVLADVLGYDAARIAKLKDGGALG